MQTKMAMVFIFLFLICTVTIDYTSSTAARTAHFAICKEKFLKLRITSQKSTASIPLEKKSSPERLLKLKDDNFSETINQNVPIEECSGFPVFELLVKKKRSEKWRPFQQISAAEEIVGTIRLIDNGTDAERDNLEKWILNSLLNQISPSNGFADAEKKIKERTRLTLSNLKTVKDSDLAIGYRQLTEKDSAVFELQFGAKKMKNGAISKSV